MGTNQKMTVIAVANAGGSAGKTTTVASVAAILGARGQRVVVVDGDGQGNATHWLGVTLGDDQPGLGDVLLREATIDEVIVRDTSADGVWLVPADVRLYGQALRLAGRTGGEQRLRVALESLQEVDVVIVDCPGTLQSPITIGALVAADAVVTVTKPGEKELGGIRDLNALIADVAEAYRPGLRLAAVIPCDVPTAYAGRAYVDSLTRLRADTTWGPLVTAPVRHTVRVEQAYQAARPVPVAFPGEPVTADYTEVTDTLIAWSVV